MKSLRRMLYCRPRRRAVALLFTFLASAVLFCWDRCFETQEITYLYNRATRDSKPVTKSKTSPPETEKMSPRQLEVDHVHQGPVVSVQRYVKLNNVKIEHISERGSLSSPFTAEREAFKQCELVFGCEAILKETYKGTNYFTLEWKFILASGGNSTLYVKPEFIGNLEYLDTEIRCAVPQIQSSLRTGGCQLPRIDPFSKGSIMFFLTQSPMVCDGTLFTSYNDGLLEVVIDHDRGAPLKKISFQTIHHSSDLESGFILGESKPLRYKDAPVYVGTDFVQVNAEFTNGMIQTDFHANVFPKPHILKRRTRYKSGISLNIIILGLDQTSHATFQRLLPDSFKFLRDDLHAFMFEGFSLVGEGTTPQLTALLTGKTVEENCKTNEARKGFNGSGSVDGWPFIFKTLKEYGYATMFSEDSPPIGAFNMRLNGFTEPPCDHYAHPFWSAVPHELGVGLHENCINSQSQHVLQLEYLKSFFKAYPNKPKFGFAFLSSLCHQETIMPLSAAANNIYKFFRSLKDSGYLNNTMLVVMGDHGARTGEFRATLQGKLEERLPLLSVVVPESFRKKFKTFAKNLKLNSQVIVNPLDLHATFLHILNYPKNPSKSAITRGTSLFTKIPKNRTCAEANIPDYFCPCVEWSPLNVTHAHVIISAQRAAEHINNLLADDYTVKMLCAKLKVDQILEAWQEIPSAKVHTFDRIHNGNGLGIGTPEFQSSSSQSGCNYQVKFRTVPGNGIFEATVQLVNRKFIVNEYISRINIYGSQPDCIKNTYPHLRKFCYCVHDNF